MKSYDVQPAQFALSHVYVTINSNFDRNSIAIYTVMDNSLYGTEQQHRHSLKYHIYLQNADLTLLPLPLPNVIQIHGLGQQLFLISQLAARQRTRYITVSCEPAGSGQLVSVMSGYVYGPDCLGREPNLLLCCR